jgi:hypothetical protein
LPDIFRLGVVTPCYKRKGKPISDPNSYRKITVTSALGKVTEKLHLKHSSHPLDIAQNPLQKGFTRGTSNSHVAVIITELIAESKDENSPLVIGFLDAQKAFDVLGHDSVIRKLYLAGIVGEKWNIIDEWYKDLISCVKWKGNYSRKFDENQGIRQGGIWSPTAYKAYINPMLNLLHEHRLGSYIGNIYCGTPTVADDVCLTAGNAHELQAMLSVQENYVNRENYAISETKSVIVHFGPSRDKEDVCINNNVLTTDDKVTHLGIVRDCNSKYSSKFVTEERISTARKTSYALMGAGLHGLNGLNPKVSIHIIRIYVIPRLIYGLETIRIAAADLTGINMYFKRLLKQIQHLPERTSDAATYLLHGQIPITGEIHKRALTTFGNIIRDFGTVECVSRWP